MRLQVEMIKEAVLLLVCLIHTSEANTTMFGFEKSWASTTLLTFTPTADLALGGCALTSAELNNTVFQYDPLGGCLTATGAEKVLQISPRQTTAKNVWTRKDILRIPHLFTISGKSIADLSLDAQVSPSAGTFAGWKYATIYGRGRVVNDMFVVCGGGTSTLTNKACYQRPIGELTALDTAAGSEPVGHNLGYSVEVGNKQWHSGGIWDANNTIHDNTTLWNADGTWTVGPRLPMPLLCHCVVQFDQYTSYLMGGATSSASNSTASSFLYKYDWNTSTWTQKSSMSTARCGLQCWLIEYAIGSGNKTILAAGGASLFNYPNSATPASQIFDSTEIYNPSSDTWMPGPTLPALRTLGKAITVHNRYLWIGGRSGTPPGVATSEVNVLEFIPSSGWTTTAMTLSSSASIPVVIPYNL